MYSVKADLDDLLDNFLSRHRLSDSFAQTARKWFIPLAESLFLHQNSAGKTIFVGINGSQGSGKSTLCDFLLEYLTKIKERHVVSMSLDDFYYSQDIRQSLARKIHPLLATRGVPGTHDVDQLRSTLEAIADHQSHVLIPRFNKATDNPAPKSDWSVITEPVDIVLMEGWCWGIHAQSDKQLFQPVNSLESEEDASGVWREYVNQQLAEHYEPLYQKMDLWLMLKAPGFDAVNAWRCEQEHKLKALLAKGASYETNLSGLMTDNEIERFIQHYQRLTEHGLATLPESCDAVLQIDKDRNIIAARVPE